MVTLTKNIVVHKYGGSSLADQDRIIAVANHIKSVYDSGTGLVVIVSAMGKSTDALVHLANNLTQGQPSDREYDALVSTGENVSASLLSMRLIHLGLDAISLTGYQAGIQTESTHRKAKIKSVDTRRIVDELEANKVVIVTGFQGVNDGFDVTTIGRGGSDTSAVVLAASLGLDHCEIYTDVDGIYTTDPRIEPKAKKISHISYDEMLDLASLGAKVLHPRAVEVAKEKGVKLMVLSSFNPTICGTTVEEVGHMEIQNPVTGIALKEQESRLSIMGVPDTPGIASRVFTTLAEKKINVDMIIQSTEKDGINNISFTVSTEDLNEAKAVLEEVSTQLGAEGIKCQENIAKISIVGIGMVTKPGVAAKMFRVLAEAGINIHLISTSEIKVSCAIDQEQGKLAVNALHAAFELEN